ncbi:hypothetical protein HUJ04_004547 [Dendroctonus ponderosae]|nr:hypothetical protein HUJ04_004547 [Dendroctonus ponderosae]
MGRDPERTKAVSPHKRCRSKSVPGQGRAGVEAHQTGAKIGGKGPFLGSTLGQDRTKTGAKFGHHSQGMLLRMRTRSIAADLVGWFGLCAYESRLFQEHVGVAGQSSCRKITGHCKGQSDHPSSPYPDPGHFSLQLALKRLRNYLI